jgi:leader peptidase (prepilin peptidase)/N-methyltransferase
LGQRAGIGDVVMEDIPTWILLVVVAPFIGSFLAVVATRLPKGQGFVRGRSRCDHCGTPLGIRDLVPVASWLALEGRCRHCNVRIDPSCLVFEITAPLIVFWAATELSDGLLIASCIFGWLLLTLAAIDVRTFLLPDLPNAVLAASGLAVTAIFMPEQWIDHLVGMFVGFGVFWLVAVLYRKLRHRDGLGLGDAKLLGAIGAWVSWEGFAGVVFLASALGLLAAIIASLAASKQMGQLTKLPFGPFLAAGGWLVWLYGAIVFA